MGDAGPPTPTPTNESRAAPEIHDSDQPPRTVHVLVTGFGPFKSFTNNPSWRIAESLPTTLDCPSPSSLETAAKTPGGTTPSPYRIQIHVYPSPIRVSYAPTASLIPQLLDPARNASLLNSQTGIDFDYVLHIGLASGRESYTLETCAHRDFYRIRDVDDRDGYAAGERVWRGEGVPEVLECGWDGEDVLRRWEGDVRGREALEGNGGKEAVVKLSRDAGRFLCEFILMCALVERWRGAKRGERERERVGKVAFLHVPNGTEMRDVERGRRVALGAIAAVVASWEEGFRNPNWEGGKGDVGVGVDVVQKKMTPAKVLLGGAEVGSTGAVRASAFESKTTGDA